MDVHGSVHGDSRDYSVKHSVQTSCGVYLQDKSPETDSDLPQHSSVDVNNVCVEPYIHCACVFMMCQARLEFYV
jgi:hypothetical protein